MSKINTYYHNAETGALIPSGANKTRQKMYIRWHKLGLKLPDPVTGRCGWWHHDTGVYQRVVSNRQKGGVL